MSSVNIADLKNNLSRYLARVREGAEFTVLDRDTPVARLVPFAPRVTAGAETGSGAGHDRETARAHVAELQRIGILGPGDAGSLSDWLQGHQPVTLPEDAPSAVDVLLQMRRESTR